MICRQQILPGPLPQPTPQQRALQQRLQAMVSALKAAQSGLRQHATRHQCAQLSIRLFFWQLMAWPAGRAPARLTKSFVLPRRYRLATFAARLPAAPAALQAGLNALCAAQADPERWQQALYPAWFGEQPGFAGHGLPQLARHIAAIDFDQVKGDGKLLRGHLLEYVIGCLELDASSPPPAYQKLMADLIAPAPGETLIDTTCASGQLLAEMIRAAGTGPTTGKRQAATGIGFEADSELTDLATMVWAASGLHHIRLARSGTVQQAMAAGKTGTGDCVCAVQHEGEQPMRAALPAPPSGTEPTARWPTALPSFTDARVAHAWASLAELKPGSGRAIWLWPLSLLASEHAASLLRWLVAANWLDALIELPPAFWLRPQESSWLLMVCQQRSRAQLAYIAAELHPHPNPAYEWIVAPWQHDTIRAAYAAWQQGQAHPCCLPAAPDFILTRLRERQYRCVPPPLALQLFRSPTPL
jgi:hypothetical protein